MINRNNYESYLIDYLDGNLTPEVRTSVEAFIMANPDLASELDGLDDVCAPIPEASYSNKQRLKKSGFNKSGIENETDFLLIAELEADIDEDELEKLRHVISSCPEIAETQRVYSKTKLLPDTEITFDRKHQLKHRSISRTIYRLAGMAAAVTLMFGSYWFYKSQVNVVSNEIIANTAETKDLEDVNVPTEEVVDIPSVEVAEALVPETKTSKPVDNTIENKLEESVQETIALCNSTYISEIKPIEPIGLSVSNSTEKIKKAIATNTSKETEKYNKVIIQHIEAQKTNRTKEITARELALKGVKKLAEYAGIKSKVRNNNGKVTKVTIEGNLLAFSSTYNKKTKK